MRTKLVFVFLQACLRTLRRSSSSYGERLLSVLELGEGSLSDGGGGGRGWAWLPVPVGAGCVLGWLSGCFLLLVGREKSTVRGCPHVPCQIGPTCRGSLTL